VQPDKGKEPYEDAVLAFVYLLRCADGRDYVGSTRKSLEERVAEHNAAHFRAYTAVRRSVTPVWCQEFDRKPMRSQWNAASKDGRGPGRRH
jgi:predicted GIY-YIG superfamily endonuclease